MDIATSAYRVLYILKYFHTSPVRFAARRAVDESSSKIILLELGHDGRWAY